MLLSMYIKWNYKLFMSRLHVLMCVGVSQNCYVLGKDEFIKKEKRVEIIPLLSSTITPQQRHKK